jgi:histone deacetylase 11
MSKEIKQLEKNWIFEFDNTYVPIIYRKEVNIGFLGFEKYHHFDSKKFEKISNLLLKGSMKKKNFFSPKKATIDQLLTIHTKEYLDTLSDSESVSVILELEVLKKVPNFILWYSILDPMLYHVGATILGGDLALKFGWSICLSGGMHHASSEKGGGW